MSATSVANRYRSRCLARLGTELSSLARRESETHDRPTRPELEKLVEGLADLGRWSWRTTPSIDLRRLCQAPLIAEYAASAREEPEISEGTDAQLQAVASGVEAAITRLPAPFSDAASAHFGYEGPENAPWGLTTRKERAARHLGKSGSWYRRPNEEYAGLRPAEYVVRMVTLSLLGEADPIGWLNSRMPEDETENSKSDSRFTIETPSSGQLGAAMLQATSDEFYKWDFRPAAQRKNEALATYQRRHSLRLCLDGPTFLHPDAYFDRYLLGGGWQWDDGGDARINEFVRRHLAVTCRERNPNVRIVLMAPDLEYNEYVSRVARFTSLHKGALPFFIECISRMEHLWGSRGERGPDLVWGSTSRYRGRVITTDASLLPFGGTWMINSAKPGEPGWRDDLRDEFDATFDAEYRGQAEAQARLLDYLTQLSADLSVYEGLPSEEIPG